ncbi:MAG: hypothetical protein QXU11_08095 [Thermoproteota archaeon]
MVYKYVLKYSKGKQEKVRVEAWPKSRSLALTNELRRPSFIIGSLTGGRVLMVRPYLRELADKYGFKKTRVGFKIEFPSDSTGAIVDAYRIGLMIAAISHAETEESAEQAMHYVLSCTPEEVWFWTSKFLGVVYDNVERSRVIDALCIIGGALAR